MTRKTPEKFARSVLWQLAGLRAAVDQLRDGYCIEIAAATRVPPKRVARQLEASHKKLHKKLYAEFVAFSLLDNPAGRP